MLDRRALMRRFAGLPLAAVLADPLLARAAAAGLDTVEIKLAGGKIVTASVAVPQVTPAPSVLLVHEWWGLNDQIKAVAATLAEAGYLALAVDLYDRQVTTDRGRASALMRAVDPAFATETLREWVAWMRRHTTASGKLATVGWCFGGGWSLNASLAAPVDATIVYYGRVNKTAAQLAPLSGPVLGHFATQDTFIDKPMVNGFVAAMDQAGKAYTVHWYDANHAFANPTSARYDADDAALAWDRTLAFLAANLKA